MGSRREACPRSSATSSRGTPPIWRRRLDRAAGDHRRDNVIRGNHASPGGGGVGTPHTCGEQPDRRRTEVDVGGRSRLLRRGTDKPRTVPQQHHRRQPGADRRRGPEPDAGHADEQRLDGPGRGAVSSRAPSACGHVFAHNDVYNGTASPYAGCADQTGTNGNISADPLLAAGLPAARPARRPSTPAPPAPALPATDQAGNPRSTDGNGDGVAVVDMGAYEAPAVPVARPTTRSTPARILDTRAGNGAPAAKLGPGAHPDAAGDRPGRRAGHRRLRRRPQRHGDRADGRPASSPPGRPGAARPLASNLNYVAGQTVPNLVVVKVGDRRQGEPLQQRRLGPRRRRRGRLVRRGGSTGGARYSPSRRPASSTPGPARGAAGPARRRRDRDPAGHRPGRRARQRRLRRGAERHRHRHRPPTAA